MRESKKMAASKLSGSKNLAQNHKERSAVTSQRNVAECLDHVDVDVEKS